MISAPRVLIESPTFQNQRIGVARVYEGAQTANALMQGADEIAGLAFRAAAEDAERQGQEMAMAASRSDVMGIDPNTGEPIALAAMGEMGRIGSEAYRRVINTRFQQSIEEEIRNQGVILAAEYDGQADGPALYAAAMADYISSMSANATGQWRGIIEDTGTSYINRTRATLLAREMAASRRRMAASARRAREEAANAIRASAASGDFLRAQNTNLDLPIGSFGSEFLSFGNEPMPQPATSVAALSFGETVSSRSVFPEGSFTSAVDQMVRTGLQDEIEAQVVAPSAMADWDRDSVLAGFEGAVEYVISQVDPTDPESVDMLNAMESSIGSNNVAAFMRLAPQLRSFAPYLINDRDLLDDARKAVDGLLTNASDFAEYASADRLAQMEREASRLDVVRQIAAEEYGTEVSDVLRRTLGAGDPMGAVVAYSRVIPELQRLRQERINAPDDNAREQAETRAASIRNGLVSGVVRGIAAGQGQEDIRTIQNLFMLGDTENMTPSQRAAYRLIENVRAYDPDVFDEVNRQLGSLHSSAAAGQDLQDQENAFRFVDSTIRPAIGELRSLNYNDLGAAHGQIVEAINQLPLSLTDRRQISNDVHLAAAQSSLSHAMEIAAQFGEGQVNLAQSFAEEPGVAPAGLNQNVVDAIRQAVGFADLTGQERFIATNAATYAQNQRDELSRQAEVRERNILIARTLQGYGDSSTRAGREAAQDALNNIYQTVQLEQQDAGMAPSELRGASGPVPQAIQREVPPDFWTNGEYLNDSIMSEVQRRALNVGNMLPTDLHTAFRAVASGSPVQALPVILTHYRRARTIEQAGVMSVNPAITNSMSDSDIAIMEMLVAAEPIFGTQGLVEANAAYARWLASQRDGGRPMMVGNTEMSQFLSSLDGWDEYSPELQSAVTAVAVRMNEYAIATEGQAGYTPNNLGDKIEELVDMIYPSGDGVVMAPSATGGMTNRTIYPLARELTPAGSRTFLRYIESQVLRETGTQIGFNNVPRGADEPVALEIQGAVEIQEGQPTQRPTRNTAFLVPYGRDSFGGIAYAVAVTDPVTLQPIPIQRPDGAGPYIFSTREPEFRSLLESRFDEDEMIRRGNLINEQRRQMLTGDIELLGIE